MREARVPLAYLEPTAATHGQVGGGQQSIHLVHTSGTGSLKFVRASTAETQGIQLAQQIRTSTACLSRYFQLRGGQVSEYPSGTVLTCSHDDCSCRVRIEVECD
jgi:hypothetical protein